MKKEKHWLHRYETLSERLKAHYGDKLPGVETVHGAALAVLLLREALLNHHGGDAFRIIKEYGKPATKTELSELLDWELLERFDAKPGQEITQFACDQAEENKRLPKEQRKGPGGVNAVALYKYIGRLLDRRKDAMQNGEWDGPVPPQ
jgi:hypothetical protein